MSHEIVELDCAGCGAHLTTDTKECPYCQKPIIIKSVQDAVKLTPQETNKMVLNCRKALVAEPDNQVVNNNVAMCFMRLRMFDKAGQAFEKAMENNFDNGDTFFWAAVCQLQGKKAFMQTRPVIDKILEFVNAAIMIEDKGIYHYFLAYIKYDYFSRKFFRTTPDYKQEFNNAVKLGTSMNDVNLLYQVIGVERPSCL